MQGLPGRKGTPGDPGGSGEPGEMVSELLMITVSCSPGIHETVSYSIDRKTIIIIIIHLLALCTYLVPGWYCDFRVLNVYHVCKDHVILTV